MQQKQPWKYCNILLQYSQGVFYGNAWIKRNKKEKNLNQLKVAMDLSISREALSLYENGKRNPSLDMLVALSKYFNVSIDYLITGSEFEKIERQ